jgi:hypothetical protein
MNADETYIGSLLSRIKELENSITAYKQLIALYDKTLAIQDERIKELEIKKGE